MKKTRISRRHSPSSTHYSGDVNKTRNASKARLVVSPSSSTPDIQQTSKSDSVFGKTLLSTQTSLGARDRQLQKYQQQLEHLKKENKELKAELQFISSLYKQLVEEAPQERFDERRVNLLKSQVIQLERQVLLQASALQARKNVFIQIENKLLNLKEALRSLYSPDDPSNYITVLRECIQNLEYRLEGTRLDLYKNKEIAEADDLCLPAIYMGDFLKQSKSVEDQTLTLLDCCSGKVEHLNLKHVSRLESKLCKLYKNMVCLNEMLQLEISSQPASLSSEHISQPIRDRLEGHVTTVTDILRDCCQDLLSLSVLYPAAPWPPLKKVIREDLTEENVMSHMPELSRKKQQEVRSVVQALMKSISYTKHILSLEIKILKEELSFHRQVYQCQVDYAESLLSAVREAYQKFEGNLMKLLCEPLEDILSAYRKLKNTASEDDLQTFLSTFKDHESQFSDAMDLLQPKKEKEESGITALSEFQTHFVDSLHSLTRKCVSKRDMLMKQLLEAKDGGLKEDTTTCRLIADGEAVNTSGSGKGLSLSQQVKTLQ
ncbi:uncharacterized protein LOC111340771 isoform X1 [Stylophora pistillata]|uniref:Uncharacterized protein n=1 Tax=Stylophora pistillata TaxID=50429 RepID=A0A2B4RL20_STYPI|nr:uncharacterized protein LOC111340771 isoform X1 [Stylophora pistillata]PFX17499.1 hypothetical protein AWC38_SpisGene18179 [Stylophora pistillata]